MAVIRNPIAYLAKRYRPPPWTADLTEKQLRVYNCTRRFFRACAGRQSGKSHVCATWLLGGPARGESMAFARTSEQVRAIYLPPFYELNERYKLGLRITGDNNSARIEEPSGHTIKLMGIRDKSASEKLRGQRFWRVVADEMGTYKHDLIKWIIQDVLQPTLLKHSGRLLAVGTPGVVPEGFWYELCHGRETVAGERVPAWPVDFGAEGWTLYDNPHLPNVEQFIDDLLRDNGWTRETAQFQREYLARWVRDAAGLVYQWFGGYEAPPSTGTTVLGVDIGYDDGNGFVVCRMAQRPHIHVLRAFTTSAQTPHEVVEVMRQLITRYNVNHIIADTGGSGKGIVEMFKENFRVPVDSAKKIGEQNKRANIDYVRGAIMAGNLHMAPPVDAIDRGSEELLQEWSVLQWSEDRMGHCEGFQDELSDALIYALKLFLQTPGGGHGDAAPPDPISLEKERRRRAAESAARRKTRQRWKA